MSSKLTSHLQLVSSPQPSNYANGFLDRYLWINLYHGRWFSIGLACTYMYNWNIYTQISQPRRDLNERRRRQVIWSEDRDKFIARDIRRDATARGLPWIADASVLARRKRHVKLCVHLLDRTRVRSDKDAPKRAFCLRVRSHLFEAVADETSSYVVTKFGN